MGLIPGVPDIVIDIGAMAARGLAALREIANTVPRLEDEVTVEVVGNPGASKQQLYFLALAAANGMVHRFAPLLDFNPLVAPTMGMLMIEYDAADNWVRCTLRYSTSTLAAATTGDRRPTYYNDLAVYRGPQCKVVGEAFDFTSATLPGIPASAVAGGSAPVLPFEKQTIVTPCATTNTPNPKPITQDPATNANPEPTPIIPSFNPKPPGDNRSRGSAVYPGASGTSGGSSSSIGVPTVAGKCCDNVDKLIPLVFAALSDPAGVSELTFPNPTAGPTGI